MRRLVQFVPGLSVFLMFFIIASSGLCRNTPVILDSEDTQDGKVVISGNWTTSTWKKGGRFKGANYIHDADSEKGEKQIAFLPGLNPGEYSVFIRYTSSFNRADNVPVEINYSGKTTTHTIDQTTDGGVWHLLGTYSFSGGGEESLVVKNKGTSGYVVVDSVAFIPGAQYPDCNADLISYWAFDDKDEIAQDAVGKNTGWIIDAESAPGKVDNSLSFDGNDHVLIEDAPSLRLTKTFTISTWVKQTKKSFKAKIVSRTKGDYFYFLGIYSGKPYAGIGNGERSTVSDKSFELPLNEWHHLAVSFDTQENQMVLYYDGQVKETVDVEENLPPRGKVPLIIGAGEKGRTDYFIGLIDELALYGSALSEMEVKELYLKGQNNQNICTGD